MGTGTRYTGSTVLMAFKGPIMTITFPLNIVIADDSELYRKTLSDILRNRPDLRVVAEAENGRSAIQQIENYRPDVVLMDITMPDLNGIEATMIVKSKWPEIKVIILTFHGLKFYSEAACNAGASGCLSKDSSTNEIIDIIMNAGTC